MKLQLITYGCGEKFDPSKFTPIKNIKFVKPEGGLWASPIESSYGWRDWCRDESYDGKLSQYFTFILEGNIYTINNTYDASCMPWIKEHEWLRCPDFEQMVKLGYDAIFLTEEGQQKTRFGKPSLYGWDCESVLILNKEKILTNRFSGACAYSAVSTNNVSGVAQAP